MCAQIATLFNSVAFWGIADCLPVYLLDDALDYCIAVVSFVSLATWRQVSHLDKNCYFRPSVTNNMDDAITDAATHVDVTQTVPPKHQHVHRLCVVRVIILNA